MLHFFARRLSELHEKSRDERGFTLIELLVVVVIIGILASIAIPAFLNQRAKAGDASAQSSLRNAATAQETYQVQNDTYATTVPQLKSQGFRESSAVTFNVNAATNATFYCMSAKHAQSATTWWLTSDNGAPVNAKPASCT
jgi:type IV pilus assembly protein PilA